MPLPKFSLFNTNHIPPFQATELHWELPSAERLRPLVRMKTG